VRSIMGFGAHAQIHKPSLIQFSPDSTVILEIVDTKARIDSFMITVDKAVHEGLVTKTEINARRYRAQKPES